jgi:uncharacterized protein YceK
MCVNEAYPNIACGAVNPCLQASENGGAAARRGEAAFASGCTTVQQRDSTGKGGVRREVAERNDVESRNWGSRGATLPALGNLRPHSSNPGARRYANALSACFSALL